MLRKPKLIGWFLTVLWLFLAACNGDVKTDKPLVARDTVRDTVFVDSSAAGDSTSFLDPMQAPITLPVLDGFFQDSSFATELRDSLGLTEEQLTELRRAAREEGSRLDADSTMAGSAATDSTALAVGTSAARRRALERIGGIIGPEKTTMLARFVRSRWQGTPPEGAMADSTPNSIPGDTRIVINAPSFRMDLFENGRLVKSYPIASGYPEFPLPTGLRSASEIIFNPPWTPPDEPWVESSNKVKVGQRVAPGDRLNPLGIMKIPIGGPSLIHGGKTQGQLGTFGSHGCAGLTDALARDFVRLLAKATGTELDDARLAEIAKDRTKEQHVKLAHPIPVELRYETMVVQDGALHIYPDVYDRGANTPENLDAVLQAYGISREQLSDAERAKLDEALATMSSAPAGRVDTSAATATGDVAKKPVRITRSVKGPKELVVPIAALKGKGYPAMNTRTST
jgi:lipoprotein-anchoring transpeptidase ErfK/SrfK